MAKKPKIVRSVAANRGIESAYHSAMRQLIDEMHASVQYWLSAAYKKFPPRVAGLVEIAEDAATPSVRIRVVIDRLTRRWQDKFDETAPKIASKYIKGMFKASDSAFRSALKDQGWSVDFKMTPAVRDALNASLTENVGLIKSIPESYFNQVEGAVMRSYSAGRDLESMTQDIQEIYPVTKKRATLIARDQSNKANAIVTRTRQMELGITDAIWMHSHAGKTPRPSHEAANGKQYKIADGCLIDGELIQPGEKVNCRCTSRPILPI